MNPQSPYSNGPLPTPSPAPTPSPMTPTPGYTPVPNPQQFVAAPKPSKMWMILSFVFIFTTVSTAGVLVWALLNYFDAKDNLDTKVADAVATAVKEQADKDALDFQEKEKEPNRQFAGPEDYGRVAFNYPKTWSVYVDKDAVSGGTYTAYFNPVSVPPIKTDQQFALRLIIEDKDYDAVVNSYQQLVKRGDLKSTAVKADGNSGTRLDGQFTKDVRGFAVIFKIRDKTVTIRSDAETFKGDFNALIKTITFNK